MLVDRLWPRGTREEPAHPDQWLRDVTPSADLRHWHHHDQERFAEFGIATSANWRTPITARPYSTCVISPPTTRSPCSPPPRTSAPGRPQGGRRTRPVARLRRHSEPLDPCSVIRRTWRTDLRAAPGRDRRTSHRGAGDIRRGAWSQGPAESSAGTSAFPLREPGRRRPGH
ncbi:DUF488 domain-containing protein [Streptomyces sp. 900105755]